MRVLWFVPAVALLCSGCGAAAAATEVRSSKPHMTSPQVTPAQLHQLAADNNTFAFQLYQRLRANKGNLFLSPYSISTALAMTYAGARGQTAREMADTLRFYLPPEELHPAFNALGMELASRGAGAMGRRGKPFRLHIANAMWALTGHPFLPSFLDLLSQQYDAGVRLLDFARDPEACRVTINDWVSQETEQKIAELVPRGILDHATAFVLTNAIYFDAAWLQPFAAEATGPESFYLLGGRQITVDMMHKTAEFAYTEGENYQALDLPYSGNELAMLILLPASGRFDEFDSSCDAAHVGPIIAKLGLRRVMLTMPKFKFESAFSLKQTLSDMGMRTAFMFPAADFSGMDGEHVIYLTAVLHKALVRVDEEGTEAAAATAVVGRMGGAGPSARPIEFTADRPFIFLIHDRKTGAILFLGRVLDPRG
jgi:serpin B